MTRIQVISFTIPGVPVAKGRPKFKRIGSRIMTYTPAKTHKAEEFVKACFEEKFGNSIKTPINGAICLTVEFFMQIPTSLSKKKKAMLEMLYHTKRPDIDNLIKTVQDGLNGVAWTDDSCVCCVNATKVYSSNPCTKVEIKFFEKDLTNK